MAVQNGTFTMVESGIQNHLKNKQIQEFNLQKTSSFKPIILQGHHRIHVQFKTYFGWWFQPIQLKQICASQIGSWNPTEKGGQNKKSLKPPASFEWNPVMGRKIHLYNPNCLKLRNLVPDSPAVHSPNTACENPSCNPNNPRFFHGIQVADVCYLLKNLLPESNPKFLQLHPCEAKQKTRRIKDTHQETNISPPGEMEHHRFKTVLRKGYVSSLEGIKTNFMWKIVRNTEYLGTNIPYTYQFRKNKTPTLRTFGGDSLTPLEKWTAGTYQNGGECGIWGKRSP